MTSYLLCWLEMPFEKGSTLEGKNLHLDEQILFFKSRTPFRREAKMKMEELLPLKVFPFTLRWMGTLSGEGIWHFLFSDHSP